MAQTVKASSPRGRYNTSSSKRVARHSQLSEPRLAVIDLVSAGPQKLMMTRRIESKYFLSFQAGPDLTLVERHKCSARVQASSSSHQEPLVYVHNHWASVQVEPTTYLVLMQAACFPSLLEYSKKRRVSYARPQCFGTLRKPMLYYCLKAIPCHSHI